MKTIDKPVAVYILNQEKSLRGEVISDYLGIKGLSSRIVLPNSLPQTTELNCEKVFVWILSEVEKFFFNCTPVEFEERVDGLATELFQVAKWAISHHDNTASHWKGLILRPMSEANDLGLDLDAGAAFLKSLRLEYPQLNVKWLQLPTSWSDEKWADVVFRELQTTSTRTEFRYNAEGTRTTQVARQLDRKEDISLQLDTTDTVLVTGGAKGITCELALGLARHTQAKFALMGSSPLPDPSKDSRSNEILDNLKRFEQEGFQCLYIECDITVPEEVKKAVNQIETQLGSVTAILHGAGISQLKRFSELDIDSYLRCINIKTQGLFNLLRVCSLKDLKALHVISSVLGKTGMPGQVDYTFANAWLAGALESIKQAQPQIHTLSLGYSVWGEKGIGIKLGAVERLKQKGVTPISTKEGVAAYLGLIQAGQTGSFLITGRLTPELEANLFLEQAKPPGRFLEKILRKIEGIELIAEATLSHDKDRYLPEHVWQGTPIFPAVMGLEAITEVAMACVNRQDLPTLRNVHFYNSIIIPQDQEITIRILALANPSDDNSISVQVAIRSQVDNFQQDRFVADCVFSKENSSSSSPSHLTKCPEINQPLDIRESDFSPELLFQGKFFRRIETIYSITPGKESLSGIRVPNHEKYYRSDLEQVTLIPSPAVQDSFFQAGSILLPTGYLPIHIGEIHFYQPFLPGSPLLCQARIKSKTKGETIFDYFIFTFDGDLVETITGIVVRSSQTITPSPTPVENIRIDRHRIPPIPFSQVNRDLEQLYPDIPHTLVFVNHDEVENADGNSLLSTMQMQRIRSDVSPSRQRSAIANEIAVGQVATEFAHRHLQINLSFRQISLAHGKDGNPKLEFDDSNISIAFNNVDLSLTDGMGVSVALMGMVPLGVDIEEIKIRDAETWSGLLGENGYALARQVAKENLEPFDYSATRVWTIIEAGKKATQLKRCLPNYEEKLDVYWLTFSGQIENKKLTFLSTIVEPVTHHDMPSVLTICFSTSSELINKHSFDTQKGFETIFEERMEKFCSDLREFQTICTSDPETSGTAQRYALFNRGFVEILSDLNKLTEKLSPEDLLKQQRYMSSLILPFLDESIIFRRALTKPLGYPGDHILMELMIQNTVTSRGLGYHFDYKFLSEPGSEAVRQRTLWVVDQIEQLLRSTGKKHLKLLDLGCGPMAIENALLKRSNPDYFFEIVGVDFDELALTYANSRLKQYSNMSITTRKENLVTPGGMKTIEELAAKADVCISMGLIEYLSDETVETIFKALYAGAHSGTQILIGNYLPNHQSRLYMEWFMDWYLYYRQTNDMQRLAKAARFSSENIYSELDATQSLVLLKLEK